METFERVFLEDLISYGLQNSSNIVDGHPWSFQYRGFAVTHETNERYRLTYSDGWTFDLTPENVILFYQDKPIGQTDI